ncbi:MAG: hypothetical protein UHN47_03570 [Lachnospiraceae bacterium]|nr:hypothetical protein [Lachnospiraceae bacterium]
MKRIVKGYFIWILNNALLLAWLMVAKEILHEKSDMNILAVMALVLLWFATGQFIVAAFTVVRIEHVYSAPAEIAKEIPVEVREEKEEKTNEKSKKYFFDSEIYGTIFEKKE